MCLLGFSQHVGLSIPRDRKRELLVFQLVWVYDDSSDSVCSWYIPKDL